MLVSIAGAAYDNQHIYEIVNACIESFFSHFKAECFYRYTFHEKAEVFKATKRYMGYYNNKIFQKRLNNLSPIEFGTKVA
ncbi:IS3 family transposase [Bacillus cereus]|uniref:IS3 family transposase n=1 Tax=Bacillus cereus TaxID=1396 RepID=UPI003D965C2E